MSFTNAIDPAASRLITFENDNLGIGSSFNLAGSGVGGSVNVQCINCDTNSRLDNSHPVSGETGSANRPT